ncbi:MAG: excinuclease ABC subunit UvrC, partial [Nitrospirota bacterium]|nr:excinuclease ABC subunit UvrC [Nitrospirota bacterium]
MEFRDIAPGSANIYPPTSQTCFSAGNQRFATIRFTFVPLKTNEHLQAILKTLPNGPGVYQYLDSQGEMLYVGKAKNLKNRVSSYFVKNLESGKTRLLVQKIHDIKYIVVESELDAFLLENSLIKKYQPKYNINLKDDKTYPSIVIRKEPFPRIYPTRQVVADGSEYHGPFTSARVMYTVLDLLKKLYPVRTCNLNLTKANIEAGKFKVCLEYHLGNCLGPCEGKQSEEDYDRNVEQIRKIVKGNFASVAKEWKVLMQQSAEAYRFEEAQRIKEKIDILEGFQTRSTVVNPAIHNVDVFTISSDSQAGYVNYLKVNHGSIVQGHTVELKKKMEESDEEMLSFAIVELRQRFASSSTT